MIFKKLDEFRLSISTFWKKADNLIITKNLKDQHNTEHLIGEFNKKSKQQFEKPK